MKVVKTTDTSEIVLKGMFAAINGYIAKSKKTSNKKPWVAPQGIRFKKPTNWKKSPYNSQY